MGKRARLPQGCVYITLLKVAPRMPLCESISKAQIMKNLCHTKKVVCFNFSSTNPDSHTTSVGKAGIFYEKAMKYDGA